jgi:hypothetical protein
MSSGYSANCGWTIDWENIKKIVPKEVKELEELVNPHNITIDDICRAFEYELFEDLCEDYEDDCDDFTDSIKKLFTSIQDKFKEVTDLEIIPGYHDRESSGDIYDNIDGGYFIVDGVTEFTAAGKKYQNEIQKSFWVGWG